MSWPLWIWVRPAGDAAVQILAVVEGSAYLADEGSGDLPADLGSSRSPSTPLRSTALTGDYDRVPLNNRKFLC